VRPPALPLYLTGHAVSVLGDRVSAVALPALALALMPGGQVLTLLAATGTGAQLLTLALSARLADRVPPRQVMLAADLLRLIALGVLITVLSVPGHAPQGGNLPLSALLLTAAVLGIGNAAFLPASARLLPALQGRARLNRANALKGALGQIAGLAGPALGGLLLLGGEVRLALAVDALSFAVSLGTLLLLGFAAPPQGPAPAEEPSTEIGAHLTLGEVLSEPWLRWGIPLFALLNVFAVNVTLVLAPLLAHGAERLGLLYSAEALGGVLAALILTRFTPARPGLVLTLGVLLSGLGAALIADPTGLSLAGMALFGAGAVSAQVCWATALQERVPAARLGRVSTADLLGSLALLPPGLLTLSHLNAAQGPARSAILCGAAIALLSAGLLRGGLLTWRGTPER